MKAELMNVDGVIVVVFTHANKKRQAAKLVMLRILSSGYMLANRTGFGTMWIKLLKGGFN